MHSNVSQGTRLLELEAGGRRLSTTANLVKVVHREGEMRCAGFLGVGHLHRKEGPTADADAVFRAMRRAMQAAQQS